MICKLALGLYITVVVAFWSLLIYFCECACYCLTILSDLICLISTSLNNWTIINDLIRLSLMDKMYSFYWLNRYYWSYLCTNNSRYKLLIYRMRRRNWHIYIMHIIIMMVDYIRLIIGWIKRMRRLIRRYLGLILIIKIRINIWLLLMFNHMITHLIIRINLLILIINPITFILRHWYILSLILILSIILMVLSIH